MIDVLIIEDTRELAELVRDFLRKEGFTAEIAGSGEEGLNRMKEGVRLVLLDIMLPNMDGFEVCKTIRETENVPLFILSARNEKEAKLNGLLLGADDYIEKPFDIDILIAKIKACFKRNYRLQSMHVLESGPVKLDMQEHKVLIREEEVNCTLKEYELLKLFLENEGKTLSKDWIFDKIWGVDSFSEQSTLTVHVKWLREKLEVNPKKPEYIVTVWGIGYKFITS